LGGRALIFVTVGTQLAFDRMISAVDGWAASAEGQNVFAQIGPGAFRPQHLDFKEFVGPDEADRLFRSASLVVSHAGMGSILTALKYRKPILIMPRKAALGEHRNDHQLATAKWLGDKAGVKVAWGEDELVALLGSRETLRAGDSISDFASPELIANLRNFILS